MARVRRLRAAAAAMHMPVAHHTCRGGGAGRPSHNQQHAHSGPHTARSPKNAPQLKGQLEPKTRLKHAVVFTRVFHSCRLEEVVVRHKQ